MGLLIDPNAGSEVLAMPQVAPLPGAPPGFSGLANLRGNLVPIYDLRTLLGVAPATGGGEPLVLVFGQGEEAIGVLIEGYPAALTDLRPLTDFPEMPGALAKHVPAGYMQNDAVWLEFDHRAFFEEICSGGAPGERQPGAAH